MRGFGTRSLPLPKEQFPSLEFLTAFAQTDFFRQPEGKRSYSFFWARNALYYGLKALGISRGAKVLLPAYLCRAAVEPFEIYGAEVEFYGIARDCQPDFSEIEAKITPRTEAVLAAHYFGFPQRIRGFREICDRHGLALIEDCAHVLQGRVNGQPLGSLGDVSVFSWRKFLPIYDGGELWLGERLGEFSINWFGETLPFTLKVTKSLLDKYFENSSSRIAGALSDGIESLKGLWKRLRAAPADAPIFELDSDLASIDLSLLNHRMSRVSRWMLRHSDVLAIAARRRQNFLVLQERLQSVGGVSMLHPDLPADVCPWVFPLFFDGLVNAHLLLREEGIPAVNWAGVRPPAIIRGVFPDADFLYDNLVFLPVHQNLCSRALDSIVETVKRVCTGAIPRVA